jgi:hypothetical protein
MAMDWIGGGMAIWAISDLNTEELLGFVLAYRKGTQ